MSFMLGSLCPIMPAADTAGGYGKLLNPLKVPPPGARTCCWRSGQPFWQGESYHQVVRDRTEFGRIRSQRIVFGLAPHQGSEM
jgi:hypothetical protein